MINYLVSMSNLGERIKFLRGKESLRSFASRLGVSYSSLRFYEDGRIPTADFILTLSNITSVCTDWILRGDTISTSYQQRTTHNKFGVFHSEGELVNLAQGTVQKKENHEENSFLKQLCQKQHYIQFKTTSDSMAPLLPQQTVVQINTKRRDPEKLIGKVVALLIKEKLLLRYLHLTEYYYRLHSENPSYSPLFIPRNEQKIIIGQVTCFFGKI